jgi:S-adenosylmethionine/arginine decarboxylase-like enzyme
MTSPILLGAKENIMAYWGYHLILDCAGCDHEAITSAENISAFAKQLVQEIDMVAYGEPQVVNFGSGNKAGFTLVQLIETSNITGHFVEENDTMYLDVFSCKPFDPQKVIEVATSAFKFQRYNTAYIERQAPSMEDPVPENS